MPALAWVLRSVPMTVEQVFIPDHTQTCPGIKQQKLNPEEETFTWREVSDTSPREVIFTDLTQRWSRDDNTMQSQLF